jgi:integrase
MGTIVERQKKDGKPSFTAQIRKKRKGKVILNLVETFATRVAAKSWLNDRESDLNRKGGMERAVRAKARKSVSQCIDDYSAASPFGFGKSKAQMLSTLHRLEFGAKSIDDLTAADFIDLANNLLTGVQAPPIDPELDTPAHYTLKPRKPQTVNGYMVTLGTLIRYGGPICRVTMPVSEFEEAMRTLKHHRMVKKSDTRSRRPSLEELDKLMEFFYSRNQANPRIVPMHKVIAAAIFETHRQGAILSQKWDDYDQGNEQILIRNMKHPMQTDGNDMLLDIRKEAQSIINSMPRVDDRIFPYNRDVISRHFTDACKILGIEDLHFHDLRHEGISRLFEMGLTIPQAAQVSGHRSWQSLQRYTQIKHSGDKYANWKWWPMIAASS